MNHPGPDDEHIDLHEASDSPGSQTGPPQTGSHQDQLRGELTTLHELLEGVDEVSADTKQAMQAVAADIHRLLDQNQESPGDAWSQVGTRWQQAVLNFESQHPRLTQAVDQITGLLANVGF
jgi:ElaB/YqjD/DUF883 family membrane-anchored ribosome-binding protein